MQRLVLILCMLITQQAWATNYYVSATLGSDSNAGTEDAPFKTIAKASSLLVAGDTCFIMEGIYRETLSPKNAGAAGQPIVYTNYNGEKAVISATEVVDTWVKHSGDIYKAAYTMKLDRQNMVFCDDKQMDWARWPNNTDDNVYSIDAWDCTGGDGKTIKGVGISDIDWKGGYVWYLGAHSGASWTREIHSSSSTEIIFEEIDITKWPFDPHNPSVFRNNNYGRFYLMGVLEALDYEREWFYENGNIYFQAPNNANPTDLKVEVTERANTILVKKPYIYIDGLETFGGAVRIEGSNSELKNSKVIKGLPTRDQLDNTQAQVGEGAVFVLGQDIKITNNTIDGSDLNGIFVAGWSNTQNIEISNNYISNCSTVGIHASPIRNNAPHTLMYGNTIKTTGRDGIYSSGTDCEIAYNDVSDCMHINNDGGVYYTVGNENDKNVEIHHNWFHDSKGPDYADGRCAGIYLDNHSKGYSVHHNVIWNITWSGIQINWDNWNLDIFNNSIYNVESAMDRWENGYTLDDVVLKNNYGSHEEFIGTDVSEKTNVINEESPFMSVEDHDFRPHPNARYILDKGENILGITDGFTGNAPDIGAYEYGLTAWIPGVNPVMGGEVDSTVPPLEPVLGSDDAINSDVNIFPNPLNSNTLTVQTKAASSVQIFDAIGRLIYTKEKAEAIHYINKNVFPNTGLYILMVVENDQTYSRKVLVE